MSDPRIEAAARVLAELGPGDKWPTNEELGGSLAGTRDDEYRTAMLSTAADIVAVMDAATPGKNELVTTMAVAISNSSITARPILSLDSEGDISIDLPQLARELAKAGYEKASEAVQQLDGSNAAVVSMMTGYSKSELDELGGVPEYADKSIEVARSAWEESSDKPTSW